MVLPLLALSFAGSVHAHAHGLYEHARRHPSAVGSNHFVERQDAPPAYPTGPAYDVPPLDQIVPTPVEYTENTLPVPTNFPPGSQPTLSGAPPIPSYVINPAEWPDLASVPPTDTPEVREWLRELEGHTIPGYEPNESITCGAPESAQALAEAGPDGRCWWTCGGCLRDTDITTCANKYDYGLTFDDGPGFYTNKLLTYLDSVNVKATFYVVGARVISRPEIVVYEHMTGHELSIHTWSHSALTTLTNEQIVAELGWTRKAIKDVTGVTPTTMRPPYGDIDDRVRAVSLAMGLVPVIWTAVDNPEAADPIMWDSNDFRVHAGQVESVENQARFEQVLEMSGDLDTGVIVLHHDIYVEAVNLAIGYTLPWILSHEPPFTLMPVTQCLNRPLEDAYHETLTHDDHPAVDPSAPIEGTSSVSRTQQGTGSSTQTGSNQGGGSDGSASSFRVSFLSIVVAGALAGVGLALA